ncbi:MAG: hemolysin III family protein [Firmicutes bacterium]|nr:hemolysin III family protein [Bacillota bacterium]
MGKEDLINDTEDTSLLLNGDKPNKDDAGKYIEAQLETFDEVDETYARRFIKKLRSYRKNQAIRDEKLYTLGGEIFSAITHGITALAGLAILVLSIIFAVQSGRGPTAVISVIVFGLCAFIGFTLSTVYHSLAINKGKRVMRILDHCSIYFIIAGTYTPFMLMGVQGWAGWTLLGVVWAMAAAGCTLTAVNMKKFKTLEFVTFIVMGWIGLIAAYPLISNIGWGASFWLLIGGGVAYTLGAVIFKMKGKYVHGIWHLFTLVGLVCQFLSILFLL